MIKPGMGTRTLFAGVDIESHPDVVWQTLTDYDGLGDVVPSLAVNKCLERHDRGCLLEQVGEQDVALGKKFRARVILEIMEHVGGIPDSLLNLDGKQGKDGQNEDPFPTPQSPDGLSNTRDISFKMVEGDFTRFQGVWRVQADREGRTRLSYAVAVTPQVWLPVALVEGRIASEIKRNLGAVKLHAERLAQAEMRVVGV